MPKINGQKIVPHSAEKIFNVVIDVKNYPNVLPFIQKINILSKNENKITARVFVGFSQLRFSYECEIISEPFKSIIITSNKSPFKHLKAEWFFEELESDLTQVHYKLNSEFRSYLMEATGGYIFAQQLQRSILAFELELCKS